MFFKKEKNLLYSPLVENTNKRFLFFMLYRFMSEELDNHSDEDLPEEQIRSVIESKGFYIPVENRFRNVFERYEGDSDGLSICLQKVVEQIENSSVDEYKALFRDLYFLKFKGRQQGLKLDEIVIEEMQSVQNLDLNSSEKTKFNFADAYEYLVSTYSAYERIYHWPEISELLSRLVLLKNSEIKTVCDPLCDFGSTLLVFEKTWKQSNPSQDLKIFGRTNNLSAYKDCLTNMLLHNINHNNLSIGFGNLNREESTKFDAIVTNLYSPLDKKNQISFFKYCLENLNENGIAAIAYSKNISKEVRKYLIENNCVECVIQFRIEKDLHFWGCIKNLIILRKSKKLDQTLFINATTIGDHIEDETLFFGFRDLCSFWGKLSLNEENINWIIDICKRNKSIRRKSRLVDNLKIKEKKYSFKVANYVNVPKLKISFVRWI